MHHGGVVEVDKSRGEAGGGSAAKDVGEETVA